MGYLPTKNFIAPVSAMLVVLFTGWFITRVIWDVRSEKLEAESEQTKSVKSKTLSLEEAMRQVALDTDSDGLKDWEEILWKTDREKADTDGDGTKDNDEIKEGRDPTISGLAGDDKFKKPEEIAKSAGTSTPKTISQKAVEDFARDYFAAKARLGGGDLSNNAKQRLVINLLLAVQKGGAAYQNKYAKKDIKVASIDPKKYLNNLGGTLDENFKDISEAEIDILNQMSESGDFSGIDRLDPYILAYQKTIKFLERGTAPESYAILHLALLNSMNNTLAAVENLKHMRDDPVRAFVGLQLYYKEIHSARQYLTALKNQTDKDKIVFGDAEPGGFFNQYFAKIQ